MKEVIEFIKKLWENKRTRALAILIMYGIFFIFVFAFISSLNNGNENKPKDQFYYINNLEIINYSVYDLSNNLTENYDNQLLNTNVIYNIVKNSTLESTNYLENSNTYYISINDYERIINNIIVDIDGGIRTTIKENNIILDLKDYYGYKINIDIRS